MSRPCHVVSISTVCIVRSSPCTDPEEDCVYARSDDARSCEQSSQSLPRSTSPAERELHAFSPLSCHRSKSAGACAAAFVCAAADAVCSEAASSSTLRECHSTAEARHSTCERRTWPQGTVDGSDGSASRRTSESQSSRSNLAVTESNGCAYFTKHTCADSTPWELHRMQGVAQCAPLGSQRGALCDSHSPPADSRLGSRTSKGFR